MNADLPSGSDGALPRRRPRGLAYDLVAEFTERIQSGALQPGTKLPTESDLMREHGVSRTVVREALSRLQAAGLVETQHGVGSFVLAPPVGDQGTPWVDAGMLVTVRDVIAVLEVRIALETEAAFQAALKRTDEHLQEMRAALGDFQSALASENSCIEADIRFHLAIADATGNPHFSGFMKQLGKAVIPRARIDTSKLAGNDFSQYLTRVNREHEEIYNAIRRQDADGARAAMRLHLSNNRERLRRAQEEAEHGGLR